MEKKNRSRVSIVMTTYNGEEFIREQIDSILRNINEDDELIIGDDGSTDETLSVLREYKNNNPNIKIVLNNHLGTTKNIESLLRMTNGDIVFLCDQDDVWRDNKVDVICKDFEENPDADLIFHNSSVSARDANDIIHASLFEFLSVSNRFVDNIKYFHFWGCMFAIRRRAIRYIIPFRFGFDSWIIFCTSFFGKCYIEPKILMMYRRHGGNLSTFKRHSFLHVIGARLKRIVLFGVFLPITLSRYKVSRKENLK